MSKSKKAIIISFSIVIILVIIAAFVSCDKYSGSTDKKISEESSIKDSELIKMSESYNDVLDRVEEYNFSVPENIQINNYFYAITFMSNDYPPQLLVSANLDNGASNVRIFSYDLSNSRLIETDDLISTGAPEDGGMSSSLYLLDYSLKHVTTKLSNGDTEVESYSFKDGESSHNIEWVGNVDEIPNKENLEELNWTDVSDRTLIDILSGKNDGEAESNNDNNDVDSSGEVSQPEQQAENPTVPPVEDPPEPSKDNIINQELEMGMLVFTGPIYYMSDQEVLNLQNKPDPNPGSSHLTGPNYYVILSIPEQQVTALTHSGQPNTRSATMLSLGTETWQDNYNGKTVTISVDPSQLFWPSDTGLPLGEPRAGNVKVINVE